MVTGAPNGSAKTSSLPITLSDFIKVGDAGILALHRGTTYPGQCGSPVFLHVTNNKATNLPDAYTLVGLHEAGKLAGGRNAFLMLNGLRSFLDKRRPQKVGA
jgi:hypothetical protein